MSFPYPLIDNSAERTSYLVEWAIDIDRNDADTVTQAAENALAIQRDASWANDAIVFDVTDLRGDTFQVDLRSLRMGDDPSIVAKQSAPPIAPSDVAAVLNALAVTLELLGVSKPTSPSMGWRDAAQRLTLAVGSNSGPWTIVQQHRRTGDGPECTCIENTNDESAGHEEYCPRYGRQD